MPQRPPRFVPAALPCRALPLRAAAPTHVTPPTPAAAARGGLAPAHALSKYLAQARHDPSREPLMRARLGRLVTQFFPLPQRPGATSFEAAAALAFALRAVPQRTPAAGFICERFADALDREVAFEVALAGLDDQGPIERDPNNLNALLIEHLSEPLQRGEPALLPGGVRNDGSGHAASLTFWPTASGEVLVAVADRGEAPLVCRDNSGRFVSRLFILSRQALFSPAALAVLREITTLQVARPGVRRTVAQFDAAVEKLGWAACGGRPLRTGWPYADVVLPSQSEQKGGTCTAHAWLGALHFVLHASAGTLSPQVPASTRAAIHRGYKDIKHQVRAALLEQLVLTWRDATRTNPAYAKSLAPSLHHVSQYLRARLGGAHKRADELRRLLPTAFSW